MSRDMTQDEWRAYRDVLLHDNKVLLDALRISEETCTCASEPGEDHKNYPLCPMGVSMRAKKKLKSGY